jgi:hypothetical protein
MLFGWIVRSGALAMNAGLAFLLAGQPRELDRWDQPPPAGIFGQYRGHILAGLNGARADLKANGHPFFAPWQAQGVQHLPLSRHRKHPA